MKYKAGDIAGDPDLYNGVYHIGRGSKRWECTGTNRTLTKVRFSRIEVGDEGRLYQYTIYINPEQQVISADER